LSVQSPDGSTAIGISVDANQEANERRNAAQALRRAEAWGAGQKEAFQAAMDGAPLETSLDILIRTAIEQAESERRCAFFRVGLDGTELYHVVGMGDAYARLVDGFKIGPDSLACGLAASTGRPVITRDVEAEPQWKPWLWLAREFDYKSVWSFPVETSAGKVVGIFAMYFRTPRVPMASDYELVTSLTHSASIIISHDQEVRARKQREDELKQSETRLQEALAVGSVTAYEWDVTSGLVCRSNNATKILGIDPIQNAEAFLEQIHPDDLVRLKVLFSSLNRDKPAYSTSYRFRRPDGREIWLQDTSRAEFDDAGQLLRVRGLGVDITERKRAEEHQETLKAELDHRVKNILAQVAVVAVSTRQGSHSVDEFLRSLSGRIQSMAAAHTLLSKSGWQSVGLDALVRNQLAPYATDTNISISGTDVMLTPAEIRAMAMVLHELVTNAAKYGALSTSAGRVLVNWDCEPNGDRTNLSIVWQELDGPTVKSEAQSSYGTDLIRNLIPHELGGKVDLVLASQGVSCKVEIPIRRA
jgi:PAS domain S-box-containing protein